MSATTDKLAQLQIAPADDPTVTEDDDADDFGEFGEFLQSKGTADTLDVADPQPQVPTDREDSVTNSILPLLPQPPPPASSSRPSFDVDPSAAARGTRSRRGTNASAAPRDQPELHDPADIVAAQVLEWISDTQPAPIASASAQLAGVDGIWSSAEGLMGGANVKPHIGEIATRLCAGIAFDSQTSEPPRAIVMPPIDGVPELSSAASVAHASAPEDSVGQRVCRLLWPLHSEVDALDETADAASDERANLVRAYLQLAEQTDDAEQSTQS
ncbi:hypothetical protein LPJ63_002696 [Coemansia sp. RSA 2711]|nr:hypothetical protein LPJ63_002696 [Coemansia sp. RSA 2711]